MITKMWRDRRVAALAAVAGTGVTAAVLALVMPRGPITGGQVVAALLGCFGVGVLAGFLLRSRWAMLLAPVVFVVVFELVRLDAVGPSVDRPRLDLSIGVIVFVLGRVFSDFVMLVPMVVGAAFGAGCGASVCGPSGRRGAGGPADRATRRRASARPRRSPSSALGLLLTRPGSTAPIADAMAGRWRAAWPSSPRCVSAATTSRC